MSVKIRSPQIQKGIEQILNRMVVSCCPACGALLLSARERPPDQTLAHGPGYRRGARANNQTKLQSFNASCALRSCLEL